MHDNQKPLWLKEYCYGGNMTNKRGRPRLPDNKRKRIAVSFRTTSALKAALDEAVKESGRSLAQEVELRLFLSLRDSPEL